MREKRSSLLRELRGLHANVAFIQETHFKGESAPTLSNRHFPVTFSNNNPSAKTKGVSILVSKSTPFSLQEKFSDSEGRLLFVKGTLCGRLYTLAAIYAPNVGQVPFLETALNKLEAFAKGEIVIGGDFNLVLDPSLDSSSGRASLPYSMIKRWKRSLHQHQLIDAWRIYEPTTRDYTYFSSAHNSYSRIDYILVSHNLLHNVLTAGIGIKSLSDHAPATLTVRRPDLVPRPWNWRLNESLLKDTGVVTKVRQALTEYFPLNSTEHMAPTTLWEAHKVVVRGTFIQEASRLKKERTTQILACINKVRTLETAHKASLAANLLPDLTTARLELASLSMAATKYQFKRCKRLYYEHGNKCGALLARLIRKQQTMNYVAAVMDKTKTKQVRSDKIAATFRDYYRELYNLTGNSAPQGDAIRSRIQQYIQSSGLPQLSEAALEHLSAPLSSEELKQALAHSPKGKAPGPDGYSIGYYNTFFEQLASPFLTAFNAVALPVEPDQLSKYSLESHITVVHKQGKDPLSCAGYRPISLLNTDLKLFAKIIATRLTPFIPGKRGKG